MIWQCSECETQMMEYACIGYGSTIDNGCPNCGCTEIWFTHLCRPPVKNVRVLLDVKDPGTVIRTQEIIVTTSTEYGYGGL